MPAVEIIAKAKSDFHADLLMNVTRLSERDHTLPALLKLWREYYTETEALQDLIDAKHLNSIWSDNILSSDFSAYLMRSGSLFLAPKDLYTVTKLYYSGKLLSSSFANVVPELIGSRADVLPERTVDLISYFAIRDGLAELGSGASWQFPKIEALQLYTSASNPFVRGLAMEAINNALPDNYKSLPIGHSKEMSDVYHARSLALRAYENDSEYAIRRRLIEILRNTPDSQSEETLLRIREHFPKNSITLEAAVESALDHLAQKLADRNHVNSSP